jgi:cyanophycinase-like exopeptidase
MPKTLILLLLAAAGTPLAAPPEAPRPAPELFLAGGALRTCSDLAPTACRTLPTVETARAPSLFRVDDGGISRALDPLLWLGRPQAPNRTSLAAMLSSVRRDAAWHRADLEDALDRHCPRSACTGDAATPWRRLLSDERAAILSALEVPQLDEGVRRRERAHLAQSRQAEGVEVLRAFVAAARQHANGATPRIAVVTASASDPFDPVDFYLAAFRDLGAQPQWWPVDAALNAAVLQGGGCGRLDALRREHLKLSARDRVYPDLAALQWRACLDHEATAAVPANVHGIFFAGGDQWLHRRGFFDRDDQPNAWLLALRKATAAGTLVIGGTSAGTAVQGGAAMLSNGDSAEALRSGALARPPMDAGCADAGRCADGLSEDALTYWAGGGLGLLPGWTVDTHFSERARELRLLTLMHDAQVPLAAGVDETSALHVVGSGASATYEALGASGAWIFERLPGGGDGTRTARVHYLAPGASFSLTANGLSPAAKLAESVDATSPVAVPRDALEDGALRAAAQALATGQADKLTLRAGDGRVTLARTPASRAWRASDGLAGITHLTLTHFPKDPQTP